VDSSSAGSSVTSSTGTVSGFCSIPYVLFCQGVPCSTSGGCSATFQTSGGCYADGSTGTSRRAICSSLDSSSSWTYEGWFGSTCSGTALASVSGVGSQCSLGTALGQSVNISVDCGNQLPDTSAYCPTTSSSAGSSVTSTTGGSTSDVSTGSTTGSSIDCANRTATLCFTAGCSSGDCSDYHYPADVCYPNQYGSLLLHCASDSSTSDWTYEQFFGVSDCSGTPSVTGGDSGSGTCTTVVTPVGTIYVSVDCGFPSTCPAKSSTATTTTSSTASSSVSSTASVDTSSTADLHSNSAPTTAARITPTSALFAFALLLVTLFA